MPAWIVIWSAGTLIILEYSGLTGKKVVKLKSPIRLTIQGRLIAIFDKLGDEKSLSRLLL
jgi:hypothetical protein